jgi:hypothetical protein
VTLAHIMGIPVEESVLQLAPAGAAILAAAAIAARTTLGRLQSRLRSRDAARQRKTMGEGAGCGALSASAISSSTASRPCRRRVAP